MLVLFTFSEIQSSPLLVFRMENDSTPSHGSLAIDVDDVRAHISSLTLTPSRVTPSNECLQKRNAGGKKKRLFSSAPVFEKSAASGSVFATDGTVSHCHARQPWSTDENRALVLFLLLYS